MYFTCVKHKTKKEGEYYSSCASHEPFCGAILAFDKTQLWLVLGITCTNPGTPSIVNVFLFG
jgi:hypothetical protein